MSNQQDICVTCQGCCTKTIIPINPSKQGLELYYTKGVKLYLDMSIRQWYVLIDQPCPELTDAGCYIYDKRPELCRSWTCDEKSSKYNDTFETNLIITQNLLKQMFEGEINGDDTSESDR